MRAQVYMPNSFMVNDYRQLHGAVLWHNHRATRDTLRRCRTHSMDAHGVARRQCSAPFDPTASHPAPWLSGARLKSASLVAQTNMLGYGIRHFVGEEQTVSGHVVHPTALPYDQFIFASFNNVQKVDPPTFDVWANILRRVPKSVLWMLEHHGHQVRQYAVSRFVRVDIHVCVCVGMRQYCVDNVRHNLLQRGIDPNRVVFTKKVWRLPRICSSATSYTQRVPRDATGGLDSTHRNQGSGRPGA